MGEGHSFNIHASATGMAKMAAYMANKGNFRGKSILSSETVEEFHSNPDTKVMLGLGLRATFTKGGVFDFDSKYTKLV